MKINQYLNLNIFIVLMFFPLIAKANISERFCVQPIITEFEAKDLDSVKLFENNADPIFYLKTEKYMSSPFYLNGDTLLKINGPFPRNSGDKFIELPNGDVIGRTNLHSSPVSLYKQNPDSGQFHEMDIEGKEKLFNVSVIAWSDTLRGILVSTQGRETSKRNPDPSSVYLLKKNKLERIENLEGWVTKIADFPELKLTFLGTEKEDRIYIIDGNRQVHFVTELNLGKWIFFADILYLKNPDRLLIMASETMGPYGGAFILPLKRENGIFIPLLQKGYKNILAPFSPAPKDSPRNHPANLAYLPNVQQFVFWGYNYNDADSIQSKKLYIVGEREFIEFDGKDKSVIADLPDHIRQTLDPAFINKPIPPKIFDMPASKVSVSLSEKGISIIDRKGNSHWLEDRQIEISRYLGKTTVLLKKKELFIEGRNGLFLLKDKSISGNCR